MSKKNINTEEKRHRRPPMTVNERGEVVFIPPKDRPAGMDNPPCLHKPTPLMLCNEVSKMFGCIIRERTQEECPLQGSYREIIFHLSRCDGRTQLELANLIHITPPSASVALQKLEDEGYIERRADETDKRKTRVFLTEKGKLVEEKSRTVIRELDSLASKDFSEEEINTLCVLLYRLRENIAND